MDEPAQTEQPARTLVRTQSAPLLGLKPFIDLPRAGDIAGPTERGNFRRHYVLQQQAAHKQERQELLRRQLEQDEDDSRSSREHKDRVSRSGAGAASPVPGSIGGTIGACTSDGVPASAPSLALQSPRLMNASATEHASRPTSLSRSSSLGSVGTSNAESSIGGEEGSSPRALVSPVTARLTPHATLSATLTPLSYGPLAGTCENVVGAVTAATTAAAGPMPASSPCCSCERNPSIESDRISSGRTSELEGPISPIAGLSRGSSSGSSASAHMRPANMTGALPNLAAAAPQASANMSSGASTASNSSSLRSSKTGRRFVVADKSAAVPTPAIVPGLAAVPVAVPMLASNDLSQGEQSFQPAAQLANHQIGHVQRTCHSTPPHCSRISSQLSARLPTVPTPPDGRLGTLVTRGRFQVGGAPAPAGSTKPHAQRHFSFTGCLQPSQQSAVGAAPLGCAGWWPHVPTGSPAPVVTPPAAIPPPHGSSWLDPALFDKLCQTADSCTRSLSAAMSHGGHMLPATAMGTPVEGLALPASLPSTDTLPWLLAMLEARRDALSEERTMLIQHNRMLRDALVTVGVRPASAPGSQPGSRPPGPSHVSSGATGPIGLATSTLPQQQPPIVTPTPMPSLSLGTGHASCSAGGAAVTTGSHSQVLSSDCKGNECAPPTRPPTPFQSTLTASSTPLPTCLPQPPQPTAVSHHASCANLPVIVPPAAAGSAAVVAAYRQP